MPIPHPANHPTGISGCAVVVLLMLAKQVGLDLTYEQALAIVGLVVGLVSIFSPRTMTVIHFTPEDKDEA